MKNVARTGWPLVLTALLIACGQNPLRPSEAQQAAVQWNQRAQVAYARGDYAQALAHYQQALALSRAIEDVNGIARELINLAVVHRKLGRPASARAALDEILVLAGIPFTAGQRAGAPPPPPPLAAAGGGTARDLITPGVGPRKLGRPAPARAALDEILVPAGIPFTAGQRAEATYRLALFAAEDGDAARARTLDEQALALCAGCASEGAIRNFQAGLRLAAGAAMEAREHARRALELNRGLGDKAEEANSLRLLADAALRLKDFAAAGDGYQQALALDKDAGHPHKITADLLGLGEVALAQGKKPDAADYFRRARSVAEAAGDDAMRRQVEQRLLGIDP